MFGVMYENANLYAALRKSQEQLLPAQNMEALASKVRRLLHG